MYILLDLIICTFYDRVISNIKRKKNVSQVVCMSYCIRKLKVYQLNPSVLTKITKSVGKEKKKKKVKRFIAKPFRLPVFVCFFFG